MNKFKKMLAVILAVALIVPTVNIKIYAENNEEASKITILHTNDVHCGGASIADGVAPAGYAKLAAYKKSLEAQSDIADVIMVDAGDHIQGETIGTITKGSAIIDIMNTIGYDVAIPGNHEFDYQMSTFIARRQQANFTYVSSNFIDLSTKKPFLDQYKIVEVAGNKIAFVGISTPETYTKSTPKYFQNDKGEYIYSFSENNFYETIQAGVDAAKNAGANLVVALAHTGMTGSTTEWNSESIIANTTGIDLYIDGHSHDSLVTKYTSKDGREIPYAQTGTKLEKIGRIDININNGDSLSIDTPSLVATNELSDIDDSVKELLEADDKLVQDFAGEEIGKSEINLYAKDPATGNRIAYEENPLGNLVADAYKWRTGADIGLINSGGIRANINEGNLTANDIIKVNPWMNDVGVIEATGQTILDALEHGARFAPDVENGFLQVSGLTYEVNTKIPSPVITNSERVFQGITEGAQRRVKNVYINGKAIDPKKTYTIGSTLYILQNSGDGYKMFENCKLKTGSEYVFPTDAEILIDYVKNELKGTISANKYGQKEGRIRVYRDNTVPIYRLYNKKSGEHLFTSKQGEYNKLGNIGWVKEGVAFDAFTTDEAPSNAVLLYRLFNKNGLGGLGDHHYTTKKSEVNKLAKLGWQVDNDGKPMYYTIGEYSVYRLYNKRTGAHHYTPKKSEYDSLVKKGWTGEGKGWTTSGYYFSSAHIVNPKDTNITLLHTNDVHCGGIDDSENAVAPLGYAKLAAKKKQIEGEVDKVILADAGDHIQGETIGTLTKGSAIVDIMNAIGYDVAIPGNHEFDYQMSTFNDRRKQANYSYISSNFYDLKANKPALDPYKIINVSGYKIAFVGISTPETYTKSTPKYFQDENGEYIYSFKENELYATIQSGIDAAKEAGAEIVIALAHTGMTGTKEEWNSQNIIANTTGIDLYIDGHSHDALITKYTSKDGKEIPYAQTGTKLENIGRVDIKFDVNGKVTIDTPTSISTNSIEEKDATIKELLDKDNKLVNDFAGENVGKSEINLYAKDPETGNRIAYEENPLGNLIADAYRWKTGAAIGLINSGGVRADIKQGNLTANDLIKVNPWMNDVGVIEATGQTILDALEHGVRNAPEVENGFLQVSGITFDIDLSVESPVVLADDGRSFKEIPEGAPRRVKNVKVGNIDLNPNMTYTIGSTLYLLQNAGDGFTMFSNCKLRVGSSYVFPTDAEILIEYFKNQLNGNITSQKYGQKEGRINILQ